MVSLPGLFNLPILLLYQHQAEINPKLFPSQPKPGAFEKRRAPGEHTGWLPVTLCCPSPKFGVFGASTALHTTAPHPAGAGAATPQKWGHQGGKGASLRSMVKPWCCLLSRKGLGGEESWGSLIKNRIVRVLIARAARQAWRGPEVNPGDLQLVV